MTAPATDLTGIWHGLFSYPAGPSVPFMATLIESASRFSGATHEACSSSQCAVPEHDAFLAGQRHGSSVTFEKTYDPPAGGFQAVHYDGALSPDGNEIEGRWAIPGAGAGKFLMIRSTRNEVAATRGKLVKA
jgi:hypothetical protein